MKYIVAESPIEKGNFLTFTKRANCIVIRGKRDMFSMCIIIGFRDKYNFNRGQKDIVSGAPDDQNGRFEELGWARSFETYGAMVKCIKWKKYSSKYQIKTNAKR